MNWELKSLDTHHRSVDMDILQCDGVYQHPQGSQPDNSIGNDNIKYKFWPLDYCQRKYY